MLNHLVDSILNLPVEVLSQWGYIIVFFFSVVETLPLIGLTIPGGVIIIASGFFVKMGVLQIWPVIGIVSVGAFIGDSISYVIGRRYGYAFLTRIGKYIFFKSVHLEKLKSVLRAHPRKAIFGGRFHSLTRCITPFVAGASDINPGLFFPWAGFSAVVWTVFNVFIGYIFGHGFQIASKYMSAVFFVALFLSVFVVYIYQFISRFTEKNKYVIQRFQIYPLLLNLISIFVVAKLTESVMTGTRIHKLDAIVNVFFQKLHSPFLTDFFIAITALATPTNMTVAGLTLAIYFMYRQRWYFLALLPTSLIAGVVSFSVLKKLVHVARPLFPLVTTNDFSFPSGHATMAVIFFGLIAYFFGDLIKSILWRRTYIGACALAAITVCVSRLYLNAHWLSDVLAGIAIGVFWVTLFIILFNFFTSLSPKRMGQELKKEIDEEGGVLI